MNPKSISKFQNLFQIPKSQIGIWSFEILFCMNVFIFNQSLGQLLARFSRHRVRDRAFSDMECDLMQNEKRTRLINIIIKLNNSKVKFA